MLREAIVEAWRSDTAPTTGRRARAEDAEPRRRRRPRRPRGSSRCVVPRWVQLVLLPLAIVGAYLVLQGRRARSCCCSSIAGLIALLLNPLVDAAGQRAHIPRGAAVAIVMVGVVAFLTGLGFLLADPISDQASCFQRDVPGYVDDANDALADLQDWLDRRGIEVEIKQEGETALQTIGERITGGAGEVVGLHARRRAAARRGEHRADPDHRPGDLHAHLRRPDRRDRARRRAARRRDARGRLPDPRAGARCSATSAASSCSA